MTPRKFRRILLALDLSEMDKTLLRYIAEMHQVLGAEKIYFLHIMPDFTAPKNIDVDFHKLFSSEYPVDEKVRDKIALDVQEFFGNSRDVELTVEVVEGRPYDKLLHWIEVKEIDLLVVGHKMASQGSGIMPRRVARRAKCSILFVSEKPSIPNHVLVPIDFSDNSVRALQFAVQLDHNLPDASVTALHVVEAPPEKYYMRTTPVSGFRAMLTEAAKKAYHKMIEDNGLTDNAINAAFLEDDYISITTRITDFIDNNLVDLVVIGAQGHTAFEHFIYGSVTEKLVEQCEKKPILVIR
ncbi:MAG: universal stress protein [Saprospiraceae bacterium]|nr:universal stress protein [Saprospiraceae bacterium]